MRDFLQRLQRALPEIEQWIDALHVRYRPDSIPVLEAGVPRLAEYFSAEVLEGARVAAVTEIPFPPVSACGLPEFESLAKMPMAGITFRDLYFVQPRLSSESLHFHELVHVVQWITLGVPEFLLTYALGMAQCGYSASPLEAIASELQAGFEKGVKRASMTETIAHHAIETRDNASVVFRAHGLRLGA